VLQRALKLANLLYRLIMPGGIIVLLAYSLLRLGVIAATDGWQTNFYTLVMLSTALILSGAFHRSRLFLASLVIVLSQAALVWLSPRISLESQRVLFDAIAFLAPLNLLALPWLQDRGIISPAGKKRLIFVALQILLIAILLRFTYVARFLEHRVVPPRFSDWSHMPQPALFAFLLAAVILVVSLARCYRAVESSLLWSLVALFIALRAGTPGLRAAVYFGSAGVVLGLAVLETSYRMAYHDELTRLPSRRALNEALLKLGDSYTIAMLDVDHFKKFNDTYGHDAGDQALQMVASCLAHVTGGGKAYRYGGEEFAVLFPDRPVEEAFTYLDRLRRLIEQTSFVVRGKDRRRTRRNKKSRNGKTETNVTVSVGLASTYRNEFTVQQVMRCADQALYKAKAKGRNCTVVVKPAKSSRSEDMKIKTLQLT
jgi:diguanylate cyclase (GGDEF)-like protein